MDKSVISYHEYRKNIEEIGSLKKKLKQIITKKRISHAKYRSYYQEYKELDNEQTKIIQDLIKLIPDKW